MISEQRLFKPFQIKNNKGKEFLHMNFRDKRLDLINLSSILRKSHFKYTYIFYRKFPSIIDLRYSIDTEAVKIRREYTALPYSRNYLRPLTVVVVPANTAVQVTVPEYDDSKEDHKHTSLH